MIEALIDGERRGQVLADLAIGRMRTAPKLADLSQALTGRFTSTTRRCAGCTWTGSRCSTPPSPPWRSSSPSRPPRTGASWSC